ncbi:MAG: hypothetical protein ACRD3J_13245, partial [Thermoanaerobaculia bacterium]
MRARLLSTAAIAALLLFGSSALFAQPFQRTQTAAPTLELDGDTQMLWNAYERSIYDVSVYQRFNIRP